jgi:phosphoglycolate phosphatase-like HAD superfamily hydrolase
MYYITDYIFTLNTWRVNLLKVIFLDFDGVIVESNKLKKESFLNLFKKYEQKYQEILEYEHRCGPLSRYKKFKDIRTILNIKDETIEKVWSDKYQRDTIENVIKCSYVNGSIAFLDSMKNKKIPIMLLSNTPQNDLDLIVDSRGLNEYFLKSFGSPVVKSQKLKEYKDKFKLDKNELLFVGDNLTDMEAALVADVEFIGRFSGVRFPEGVRVVEDLEQLQTVVGELCD